MRIVEISPFKGNMMCIELTGGGLMQNMKLFIHRDVIFEENITSGAEISQDDADRLIYKNDLHRARERALYLLDARDYSYCGLFDKLNENYSDDICMEVCDRLAGSGLINDRRYADQLCRRLFEVKNFGEFRVRREMRQKGLTDDIISEAIEAFAEKDDPFARLEGLVERKYERYLTDRKGVRKVKDALIRLGYSYSQIDAVLDLYDLDFED